MKAYELPGGLGGLWKPSTADRIIEGADAKRSTKTFISTERAGLLLGLLEKHAAGVIRRTQLLHQAETGELLEHDALFEKYPGCKAWKEVHQFIVEHYASTGGFSVQATVRMAQDILNAQQQQAESSIQSGEKPAK